MFFSAANKSQFSSITLLVSISALVSACGGGGSGSSTSPTNLSNTTPNIVTSTSPTTDIPATSTTTPSTPAVSNALDSAFTKSGITTCDVAITSLQFTVNAGFVFDRAMQEKGFLTQLNHIRCLAGLGAISRNTQLDQAAENHADYSLINNSVTHEQSVGLANFSGVQPGDRMFKANYPSVSYQGNGAMVSQPQAWGEVLSKTGASATEAFEGLTAAIYHRFVMLNAQFDEVGISLKPATSGMEMITVADFASTKILSVTAPIQYPAPGQTNVPISFNSDYETPDPIEGASFVGYPISVHSPVGSTLTVQKFELRRASDNQLVESYVRGSGTAAGMVADTHLSKNESFLASKQILEANTQYKVMFVGSVKAINGTVEPSNLQWIFTTAAALPLAQVETSQLKLGQFSRVKLAGCGSTYSWRYTSGLNARVVSSEWMQVQPTASGAQWVEITDACSKTVRIDFTVQ